MKNPDYDRPQGDAWDDHFRQRFADYQHEPPADALNRILAGLSPTAPPPVVGLGNRSLQWWLGRLSIVAMIVGSTVVTQFPKAYTSAAAVISPTRTAKQQVQVKQATQAQPTLAVRVNLAPEDGKTAVPATASAQTITRDRSQAVTPAYTGTPERATRVSNPTATNVPATQTLEKRESEETGGLASLPEAQTATHNPMRALSISLLLPVVTAPAQPETAPKQPVVERKRPIVFASVMPLYTYQTIDPVADDEILVRNIQTQKVFSGQRAGVRLQIGMEWPLLRRVHLRTNLSYNQLSQSLSYSTPNNRPDSIRVERVDASTVRVTPYFNDKQLSSQTQWHHVGLGTDLVWQLGKLGAWQHSITTGASVGAFVSQKSPYFSKPITGFVQASYGLERPLTRTLWLRVAPTVQYGLNRVNDAEGLFIIRPYTYGLTIGIRK